MQETEILSSITWEAPEHRHIEKSADWYWVLWIIAIATSLASILLGNTLFGIVILLGASTVVVFSHRKPSTIPFGISSRGIMVGDVLYPFATLESFYIDEEHPFGPHLLVKSKHIFMPLIILSLPHEYLDEIEDLVAPRIPEEHLEEPFAHRLLEFLGL